MNSCFLTRDLSAPNPYELEDCFTVLKTSSDYLEPEGSTPQRRNSDDHGDYERDILDCQIT